MFKNDKKMTKTWRHMNKEKVMLLFFVINRDFLYSTSSGS